MGEGALAGAKKGALRTGAWLVFEDESGFSLSPPVWRTWAPRGQTPVLRYRFHWQRVSAAALLCYRADGQRARLYFHTHPGSYTSEILITVLRDLRRRLRAPVILIWDGLTSHWSRKMAEWAAKQKWLRLERLPAYAPDLNPCEGLWANLKGGALANRAEETIAEVNRAARQAAERVGYCQQLLFGFLGQTGLSL